MDTIKNLEDLVTKYEDALKEILNAKEEYFLNEYVEAVEKIANGALEEI